MSTEVVARISFEQASGPHGHRWTWDSNLRYLHAGGYFKTAQDAIEDMVMTMTLRCDKLIQWTNERCVGIIVGEDEFNLRGAL